MREVALQFLWTRLFLKLCHTSGIISNYLHNFSFLSKLLTAVLTHHLGWVSTVAPGDHPVNTLSQVPQVSAEHASLVCVCGICSPAVHFNGESHMLH